MEKNPSLIHEIAQRLYEERKRLGKTQKEMAEVLGVTHQWYGKVERGSSGPSLEMLYELYRKCDVDIGFVLTGKSPPQTDLDKIVEDCPKDKRFHIESILRATKALYSETSGK